MIVPVNPWAARSRRRYVLGDVHPSACVVDRPECKEWAAAADPAAVVHFPHELLSPKWLPT